MRLTAPNPGVMTGPGTNSYLVGDPDTGYIVIDPGPDDAGAHRAAVARRRRATSQAIVCTHSHPDHSPGARPLQALCAAQAADPGPAFGRRPRAPTSEFTPDRSLSNQELLTLSRHQAQTAHFEGDSHARPRGQPSVPGAGRGRPAVFGRPHPQRQHHGGRPARRRHERLPRFAGPAEPPPATSTRSTSSCRRTAMCWARRRRRLPSSRRTASSARPRWRRRCRRSPAARWRTGWRSPMTTYRPAPVAGGPALAAGACGADRGPAARCVRREASAGATIACR